MDGKQRQHLCAELAAVLTPDLLKGVWRKIAAETGNPLAGHCYAASEALYHLLGGRESGWTPCVLSHRTWPEGLDPGQTHWFIRHKATGEVLDPTAGQFPADVDYARAVGSGFLTKDPSKRARAIIERLAARQASSASVPLRARP